MIVTFTKKVNRAVQIVVQKTPDGRIVDIDCPKGVRFMFKVGQMYNRSAETWACNNGWLIDGTDPCGDKKIFGIHTKDIPAGHEWRHIFPGKFEKGGPLSKGDDYKGRTVWSEVGAYDTEEIAKKVVDENNSFFKENNQPLEADVVSYTKKLGGRDVKIIKVVIFYKKNKYAYGGLTPQDESSLQKIKSDFASFRPDGRKTDEIIESGSTLTSHFRDLGNWIDDEENSYEFEDPDSDMYDPDWREDNDHQIWDRGEYKRFNKQFVDWAKDYAWFKNVKIELSTSEKNWCEFNIILLQEKNNDVADAIAALQIIADMGDKKAKDAIAALKLVSQSAVVKKTEAPTKAPFEAPSEAPTSPPVKQEYANRTAMESLAKLTGLSHLLSDEKTDSPSGKKEATRRNMYESLNNHTRKHNMFDNNSFRAMSGDDMNLGKVLQKEFDITYDKAIKTATEWGLYKMGMPGYSPDDKYEAGGKTAVSLEVKEFCDKIVMSGGMDSSCGGEPDHVLITLRDFPDDEPSERAKSAARETIKKIKEKFGDKVKITTEVIDEWIDIHVRLNNDGPAKKEEPKPVEYKNFIRKPKNDLIAEDWNAVLENYKDVFSRYRKLFKDIAEQLAVKYYPGFFVFVYENVDMYSFLDFSFKLVLKRAVSDVGYRYLAVNIQFKFSRRYDYSNMVGLDGLYEYYVYSNSKELKTKEAPTNAEILKMLKDKITLTEDAPVTKEKKYRIGDKYSRDFDYDGMLAFGLTANVDWGAKKIEKLYDSFVDVNYHTQAGFLWEALEYLKAKDTKSAKKKIAEFKDSIKDMLALETAFEAGVPDSSAVADAIAALQIIADDGDKKAKDAIDALKLLLPADTKTFEQKVKDANSDFFNMLSKGMIGGKIAFNEKNKTVTHNPAGTVYDIAADYKMIVRKKIK